MCPPGQCHRRTFVALKPSVHPPRSPRPCPSPKLDHRGASFPFRGVKSRGSAASTLSPLASLPQRHAHRLPVSSQPQSRLLRWRDAVRRLDAGVFARPGRTARVQDFDPCPSAPSAPCPRAGGPVTASAVDPEGGVWWSAWGRRERASLACVPARGPGAEAAPAGGGRRPACPQPGTARTRRPPALPRASRGASRAREASRLWAEPRRRLEVSALLGGNCSVFPSW